MKSKLKLKNPLKVLPLIFNWKYHPFFLYVPEFLEQMRKNVYHYHRTFLVPFRVHTFHTLTFRTHVEFYEVEKTITSLTNTFVLSSCFVSLSRTFWSILNIKSYQFHPCLQTTHSSIRITTVTTVCLWVFAFMNNNTTEKISKIKHRLFEHQHAFGKHSVE